MGISGEVALAAAKKYTAETVLGGGALKGKNCIIQSITEITGGHRVTFKWTLDDGTEQTGTMDVMDGEGASSYAGKNVVHMGDSWVESYNIAELAATKIGYNVTNCGFSAAAISAYKYAGVADAQYFALIKLAEAIRDNDFTEQDAHTGTYFADALARLKAVDWSEVDVLILSYGINDYNAQNPLGDIEARDEESVVGALKTAIGIFTTINPDMEIIVTTPCYRFESVNSETMTSLSDRTLLLEYRNAISYAALEESVKLVDMYSISGICKTNRSTTLESDGLHPTVLGQNMWANAFANHIEGGYSNIFDVSNNYAIAPDNLCFDSEQFTKHKKWNSSYTDGGKKYLCMRATQQFKEAILGIVSYTTLPVGTVITISGTGKKIGSTGHRAGFYVKNSSGTNLLEKFKDNAINATSDTAFTYSFTTTEEYTNCRVVFFVKNMTVWNDGKALVRDMKCTVTIPE